MEKVKRKDVASWLSMSAGHLSEIFNNKKNPGRPTYEKFAKACPGYHWSDFAKMTGPEIENILKKHLTAAMEGDDGSGADRCGFDREGKTRRAVDRRAGGDRREMIIDTRRGL